MFDISLQFILITAGIFLQASLGLIGLLNIFDRQNLFAFSTITISCTQLVLFFVKKSYGSKFSPSKILVLQLMDVLFIIVNQKMRLNTVFSVVLSAVSCFSVLDLCRLMKYYQAVKLILEHRKTVQLN